MARPGRVYGITGISGYIGTRIVELLCADPSVERIVGVDIRPPAGTLADTGKLRFVKRDVREPFADVFNGVDVALHLAWILNPIRDVQKMTEVNLGGTRNFLDACAANDVKRVLAVSSATAYGAWPENPVPLPETHPVRPDQPYQYGREKALMEALCRAWAADRPDTELLLARPAIVIGPHVDNFISRSMLRPIVPLFGGADPPLQVIHEEDCARALVELARRGPAGTCNLGADGWMPVTEIARRFGGRLVRLPEGAARVVANVGWHLGIAALAEAPPSILPFLRYPWVVDNRRLKETLGFTFEYDTAAALDAFAAARRG